MKFEIEADVTRKAGFHLSASIVCDVASLGLVGPSGSGKSTLLDVIAGIEPGRRVVLDGMDVTRTRLEERGAGYVTQDALLFPHLSVRNNLLYSPRAVGLGDVPQALALDGLLDRMPRHLSGGERRRVALGRAILSRPRVLLLDEPFGGLDELRRREAMSLLDRVRRRYELPMVLVSHLADEIIGLTEWAVRLDSGRIVAAGPSLSVLRDREMRIDNFLEGEVSGPGRVRVDGVEIHAMLPEGVSGRVRVGCYAHDVLLARAAPAQMSARNIFATRVVALEPAANAVLARLDAPPLRVLLTPETVTALDLRDGSDVIAVIKATSIEYLGRA
jgi:molybdate transport system ATP-binding protein